jgi:hypothetical protein
MDERPWTGGVLGVCPGHVPGLCRHAHPERSALLPEVGEAGPNGPVAPARAALPLHRFIVLDVLT